MQVEVKTEYYVLDNKKTAEVTFLIKQEVLNILSNANKCFPADGGIWILGEEMNPEWGYVSEDTKYRYRSVNFTNNEWDKLKLLAEGVITRNEEFLQTLKSEIAPTSPVFYQIKL